MQQSSFVLLVSGDEKFKVCLGDILHIDSDDHGVVYYELQPDGTVKSIRVHGRISDIEVSPKFRATFVRIHRSRIVNIFKICSLTGEGLKLKHIPNKTFSISESYGDALEAILEKWKLFR